jgi:hypothetical protein
VRFVRSIFVPEDGACFQLYRAGSAADVFEATRRARLPVADVSAVTPGSRPETIEPG